MYLVNTFLEEVLEWFFCYSCLMKILRLLKKHWRILLVAIYLISPIDLIPDALVPAGFADDLLVILAAVASYLKQKQTEKMHEIAQQDGDILEGELIEE
jgi:uncharacterized membrane protein YkvA (DUF1232 family)